MKRFLPILLILPLLIWVGCEEDEKEDCAGVSGGSAQLDSCAVCDDDISNDCVQDCTGEWGGNNFGLDGNGLCDDWEYFIIDGHDAILIGSQFWMKDDFSLSFYSNGATIPWECQEWIISEEGFCGTYNNDCASYGGLGIYYNWYAVDDNRGLCMEGWHVPSTEDWDIFLNFISINNVSIYESDFFIPGGEHYPPGAYGYYNQGWQGLGFETAYWTSTGSTDSGYDYIYLNQNSDDVSIIHNPNADSLGLRVRCVKD
jgi:uncharacterized protein (TIGR02145 family)